MTAPREAVSAALSPEANGKSDIQSRRGKLLLGWKAGLSVQLISGHLSKDLILGPPLQSLKGLGERVSIDILLKIEPGNQLPRR